MISILAALSGIVLGSPQKLQPRQPLVAVPISNAETAFNERLPLLPLPKQLQLLTKRLEISGNVEYPAGLFMHATDFLDTLSRRFDLSSFKGPIIKIDGGISDLKIHKQAYVIRIDTTGVHVFGQDEDGLQMGLRRLAILAFSENGHLYLPMGSIVDWPSAEWRGFHLFAGPNARSFQQNLAAKVLLPLGFNRAVIQCEQTAWDTLPKLRGGIVMPKEELSKLFKWYRASGIEPIPLVQSFGHMEWFFRNGANTELAVNPQEPYTIDPRKPQTADILDKLWAEVIEVTRAKTVHFGCDEVGLKGMPKDDGLITSLWKIQIPSLAKIASKNQVSMMLWGDQMLGPGEAIDAAQAGSIDAAQQRRSILPERTIVGDWHYQDDSTFAKFFPSIDLWEQSGMKPIATSWFRPENVRSIAIAAVQRRCGVLETTWAGYESSDQNPFENFEQFASFLLTAEYAWSGRQDDITDLGYDYRDVFRRMWFQEPVRLTDGGGMCLTDHPDAPIEKVGRYHYTPLTPTDKLTIPAQLKATKLVFFLAADIPQKPGTPVSKLKISLSNGTIVTQPVVYGWQVRAKDDQALVKDPDYCPGAEFANGVFAMKLVLQAPAISITLDRPETQTQVKLVGLDVLK